LDLAVIDLPLPLRRAVDEALQGFPPAELARAAEVLSKRYRAELRDGRPHLDGDSAALAYLATRLPATYAAVRSCLEAVGEIRPDFAPRGLLDVGAGPGTALWAATQLWPRLESATMIEGSSVMRKWGERLALRLALRDLAWKTADLRTGLPDAEPRDLVILAYVLDEMEPAARPALIDRLWAATGDMLLLIEPGTSAGWQRILAAREQLLAIGAAIVAPCPHAAACPLQPPDWCHFARRLPRSRLHRQAKGAELPWEDEKFIYLAVSRRQAALPAARVLAYPRAGKGHVRLKLCLATGRAEERVVSRREGAVYKEARGLAWGDIVPG
jgi:ribosomal protein RSM22 (predicted rRNA methylase)